MKKITLILTSLILGFAVIGCTDDLWDKVNDLDTRVDKLEAMAEKTNSDITALQSIVNALQNNVYVKEVKKSGDGYTIVFSDGTTADIANGKNGTNGKDGKDGNTPKISVGQDKDGNYYWTIDGKWMLDANGNKIKANASDGKDGKDAVAPQVRINEESGEWEISTDGGQTWESTGVIAEGDGSLFTEIDYTDEDFVILSLADGSKIRLAKYNESFPTVKIGEGNLDIEMNFNETMSFDIQFSNVSEYSIAKPNGWKARIADGKLTVTAPEEANPYAEFNGEIVITAVSAKAQCAIAKLPVAAKASTLRILTFEDEDYKGPSDQLNYWTSLIDIQYGGPLLYGDYSYADYNWKDENNTFLSSGNVEAMGMKVFWFGGQAISNYVDMDLENIDYTKQLAVYYTDAEGNGGHNGSKNFCVHFGDKDMMGIAPALKFTDGVERVIDHMYVTNTTYAYDGYVNGNDMSAAGGTEDNFIAVAYGRNKEGRITGVTRFYLGNGKSAVSEWTKWDLSCLGKVASIEIDVDGTIGNEFGLLTPAYFAYDDVAVRF